MATRRSVNWAKCFGVAMLILVAVASFFFPIARSANAWSGQIGPELSENRARGLTQPPPPEVTTQDGGITLTYRFYHDGLPFIFIIKHRDTGHGPRMVVGTSEEVGFWFALNFDWEKWRAQGNADEAAPQNRAYVVIEDPAGEEFRTDGATGFLTFTYEIGSGAHNHYSPKLSGAYVLTGYLKQENNLVVVLQITMSVEIVEPTATPKAVPTTAATARPTRAAATAVPTKVVAKAKPKDELDLDPWVPLFAGLLGVGGALWYLLSSGLLGPLSGGGAVSTQPAPPVFYDHIAMPVGDEPGVPTKSQLEAFEELAQNADAVAWWMSAGLYSLYAADMLGDVAADIAESMLGGPLGKGAKVPYNFLKAGLPLLAQGKSLSEALQAGAKATAIDLGLKPYILSGGEAKALWPGISSTFKEALPDALKSKAYDLAMTAIDYLVSLMPEGRATPTDTSPTNSLRFGLPYKWEGERAALRPRD